MEKIIIQIYLGLIGLLAAIKGLVIHVFSGPRLRGWKMIYEVFCTSTRIVFSQSLRFNQFLISRSKSPLTKSPKALNVTFRRKLITGVPCGIFGQSNLKYNKVILYFHGGGFILGSIESHAELAARLAFITGYSVFSVGYRLSPENPYPAALEDALSVYKYLLTVGKEPANIALGGDSAGGNLTLVLLQRLLSENIPLPAAAFLISPWVDLNNSGESFRTNRLTDYITHEAAEKWSALYRNGENPADPLISPLYADLLEMPPLLIQVGTAETLFSQIDKFASQAIKRAPSVTYEKLEGMFHVCQTFPTLVPPGAKAIESIGRFLSGYLM